MTPINITNFFTESFSYLSEGASSFCQRIQRLAHQIFNAFHSFSSPLEGRHYEPLPELASVISYKNLPGKRYIYERENGLYEEMPGIMLKASTKSDGTFAIQREQLSSDDDDLEIF
ncbi:MAG: hypothetical protein K2X08_00175 [Chlamydiales bacterium]|nr:hypothetical protein [Chlamydiales bacterium]